MSPKPELAEADPMPSPGLATRRLTTRHLASTAMTVVVPCAYAALFNLGFGANQNPLDGPDGLPIVALFVLKLATVAALVVGLHRVGERIAASSALTRVAGVTWAIVGIVLVAVVALAKNRGAFLRFDHLWPGQSEAELLDGLDPGPGPDWTLTSIVTAEMAAVVALATGVAIVFRLASSYVQQRIATALVLVGFLGGLFVYDQFVGWPVMFDYDPFVGDAVLGAVTYELAFLPGPVDRLGAVALAAIAAANALILVADRSISSEG